MFGYRNPENALWGRGRLFVADIRADSSFYYCVRNYSWARTGDIVFRIADKPQVENFRHAYSYPDSLDRRSTFR